MGEHAKPAKEARQSAPQSASASGVLDFRVSPTASDPSATYGAAGNMAIQRAAAGGGPLIMGAGFSIFQMSEPPVKGPLPPGMVLQSHGLTVTQADAQHAEIAYGDSWVHLAAMPGDLYAYAIGPPIAPPPSPAPALGAFSGIVDLDAKPVLPQRLVRVIATQSIEDERIDQDARVSPLAV